MSHFTYNLIEISRRKWFYSDKLEFAVFFFINSNKEEDSARVISNINLFLNKCNDVYVIDIADKNNDINIFKSFEDIKYFKVKGGFQPEKLSCLLSNKNIIIGISSNISLNKEFLYYINFNVFDGRIFLNNNFDNSVLFVASRDAFSVRGFYKKSFLTKFKEKEIPCNIFNIHYPDFKEKSYLDFKVFDKDGEEVDLYNNKIINSMWIGDSLSNVEKLSINSFLKNGHDFHLYVYDDIKEVPDGVVINDANTILDSSKIFKYKQMGGRKGNIIGDEGFAGFADWFRYVLLHKKGGWWSDLDSICLKKFDILRPYFFTTLNGEGKWATNGIFKTQRNSLVMSFCINRCEEIGEDVGWMKTGPCLLRRAYLTHILDDFAKTEEIFDLFKSGNKIFADNQNLDLRGVYSVHMYNSELAKRKIDKNGVFPKDSLFEKLKRRYL